MCINLILPYLRCAECLWWETMEIATGGRNCRTGLASLSFSILLNMHCRCSAAKTHTGYVPGGACVFGWHPSASHRTASTNWPKNSVLVVVHIFTEESDSSIMNISLPNEMVYMRISSETARVGFILLWWYYTEWNKVFCVSFRCPSGAISGCHNTQLMIKYLCGSPMVAK